MKPQDIADLKQLVEFLKEHQIAEFDLDRGDLKIRLKFNQPEASSPGLAELARLIGSAPHGVSQAAGAAGHPPESAPEPAGTETGLHLVKSPIVGTFLRLAFARLRAVCRSGDHVTKGQVIGIVEAMKLMNEDRVRCRGRDRQVHGCQRPAHRVWAAPLYHPAGVVKTSGVIPTLAATTKTRQGWGTQLKLLTPLTTLITPKTLTTLQKVMNAS